MKNANSNVIEMDPSGTSKKCSWCRVGERVGKNTWAKTFTCSHCERVFDRDHNATRNLLQKAGYDPDTSDSAITQNPGPLALT